MKLSGNDSIYLQKVDEREQTLTAEIKRWHSETVSAFSERRDQLEAIRKDAEGAFKEHADSVAATSASFRSDYWAANSNFETTVDFWLRLRNISMKFPLDTKIL